MVIAKERSLETFFCYRISDHSEFSLVLELTLIYLKAQKPSYVVAEPQRRFVCIETEQSCILLELNLLNKMKMA